MADVGSTHKMEPLTRLAVPLLLATRNKVLGIANWAGKSTSRPSSVKARSDDALYQAQFEYGDGLTDWYPAPQNVDDVLTIALNHLARG